MRFQPKPCCVIVICLLTFGCGAAALARSAEPTPSTPTTTPAPAAVQAAVDQLRHDDNVSGEKTIRSLHWVTRKDKPSPVQNTPAWLVDLFAFLSQSASWVMWALGATGLAVATVWGYRLMRSRRSIQRVATAPRGTTIQNLDIDPASLPSDVGAAALTLLEAGRAREALSLLYRGSLSRAVHRFAAIVGDSFTEGEALRAVGRALDPPRLQYFTALVSLWQAAVYAAQAPTAESVAVLCREFAPTFDRAVPV